MKYKILALFGALILFLLVWLYISEYKYFDNTLHIKSLLLIAAAIGGAVGILIGLLIPQKDKKDHIGLLQTILFCFFTGVICLPIIAAKANRYFANETLSYREFVFIKQIPVISKPFGAIKTEKINISYYLVYLKADNDEIVRLKSTKEWTMSNNNPKPFLLPIKRGLFGYEIVILPENQPADGII